MHYTEHGAHSEMKTTFNLALAIALAAALGAAPAEAQGNGKGHGNDRDRDRRSSATTPRPRRRYDDDDEPPLRAPPHGRPAPRPALVSPPPAHAAPRAAGMVPGPRQPAQHGGELPLQQPAEPLGAVRQPHGPLRDGDTTARQHGTQRRGSYEAAHRDFHYSHDRQCRERAAQRPLDPRWQVQVRSECKAIHDDFHRRWGTSHR